MEKLLLKNVTATPHVRSQMTTQKIMGLVFLSLLPSSIFGIYVFGAKALLHIVITVLASVFFEFLWNKLLKKPQSIGDLSACVTGLLLALNLPVAAPWWIGVMGAIFAILVVKQLFGGIGYNIMNPALAARCFLIISFPVLMTNFAYGTDSISSATNLALLKAGETVDLKQMILGFEGGTIGETSVIALMIGAIILILTGVIDILVPGLYILSFSVFVLMFGGRGLDLYYVFCQLAGGGIILGAFFMATDYTTVPITKKGKYIYGILLGVLTGLFRIFGGSAEGVSFAIIFSNLLIPLIEKYTAPKAFGKGGEKA